MKDLKNSSYSLSLHLGEFHGDLYYTGRDPIEISKKIINKTNNYLRTNYKYIKPILTTFINNSEKFKYYFNKEEKTLKEKFNT